jgi:uncharacterized protein YecE (DUF72 family)
MPPTHGNLSNVRVGCAGWSLPRETWPQFPEAGSHLERYATRLNAAEINSSFYRPHQPATYARWAASVPAGFRFSAKLPKTITHEKRLRDCESLLDAFLPQVTALGEKLGCLLVQLPPSLALDAAVVQGFFDALRERHAGAVAIEPRHASWFTPAADELLKAVSAGRVLADPVMFDAGRAPGGDASTVYVRLHGSPRMYYSAYAPAVLDALIVRLKLAAASDASVWCIFDNTASGAAVPDALYLARGLARR